MNLYSIDSRIDDELENDGRGRVMDGYRQEKRLFFSFQFELTVTEKYTMITFSLILKLLFHSYCLLKDEYHDAIL
jgi:hypothetical protein